MTQETPKELSVRIHYDWLYQCRTCEFWDGCRNSLPPDEANDGYCKNEKSPLYGTATARCGHCSNWDSYDYETALEVFDGKWDHIHNPNAFNTRTAP